MRDFIKAVFILSLLSACSGGVGTMDGIMKSWEGAHIDNAISQWGYPHQKREIAGRKIYIWNRNATLTTPVTSSSTVNVVGNTAYINTQSYGGGSSSWSCTRILEVDKSNIIVGWQWEGNNCPFAEAFQYSNWRNRSPVAKAAP